MFDDQRFMARAIRLAEGGRYSTHPNPCVGCVLVRQDKIVGEGFHLVAGQGHAEANALQVAQDAARGSTAYITLEPCSFHGRTPSCAEALVKAGVARVVVAQLDPDARNAGKGIGVLEKAGIEVVMSVLAESAADLVMGHIKRHTQQQPYVRLKLAMSLDGKTALANGESKWITSPESRGDVQRLRAMSAAIVTGVQTVIDDDPLLTVRPNELKVAGADVAAQVVRPVYVLDSNLRIPRAAQLLDRDSTVVVSVREPADKFPVEVLTLPADDGRIDLRALLKALAAREHSEVLFECGGTLAGSLINEGLVDEMIIYVAPAFMGASAKSLLNLPEVDRMTDLTRLKIRDIRKVGEDYRITAGPA